jgi:hypothetical protein
MRPPEADSSLPAVDERLVAPGTPYEIIDGRVVYVPPADPPHAEAQAALGALLMAHRAEAYKVAVDMLTRTSRIDDMAPDASVFPAARDPKTGGRQLEELAFEIVSTQSIGNAATKAARLAGRGVRRVFAIDIERGRVLEWSTRGEWTILDQRTAIADPALAVDLPIAALLDVGRTDDTVATALRLRRHPEFVAERDEGRAEGRAAALAEAVIAVLEARGLVLTAEERERLCAERNVDRQLRRVTAAPACRSVADLLAIE